MAKSIVDGDFFESISDFSFGDIYTRQYHPSQLNVTALKNQINRTPVLFTNTEKLSMLLTHLSTINEEVVIISHNSDININDDNLIDQVPNNVLRVWCQNYNGSVNEKIKPLPIGLERRRWYPEQNKQGTIIEYSNMNTKQEHNVYMNFNVNTNSARIAWKNHFENKEYVYTEMLGNGSSFKNYIDKVKKSKFTLSPEGNGIDCHRNWECLEVGSIPIMTRNNFTKTVYSDMPVLLIDNVADVNEQMLQDYLNNEHASKSLDKLDGEYWKNLIYNDVKQY
jgi:hypothetical protein